jgi:PEP-CTERM putative exosortase interaction domain
LLTLFLAFGASGATADPILTGASRETLVVLEPLDPTLVLTMTSLTGDSPTEVTFHNTLATQVDVWWRDYSGGDVFYNSLRPFESYVQLTFVTHPWLIRAHENNRALVGFLPSSEPGIANIVTFESSAPTPEPATLLLLATGAAVVARRAWKRPLRRIVIS